MKVLRIIENIYIYGIIGSIGLVLFLEMHNVGAYAATAMVILLTGFGLFVASIARKDNRN